MRASGYTFLDLNHDGRPSRYVYTQKKKEKKDTKFESLMGQPLYKVPSQQ